MDEPTGQYVIKGGKTILGKIFAYQEKTGMSYKEILNMPYITFVLGMLDAPGIDYEKSRKTKEKNNINKPKTVDDELKAFAGF